MNIFLIALAVIGGLFIIILLVNARRIARIRYLPDQNNLEFQIAQLGKTLSGQCGNAGVIIGVIRHGRTYVDSCGDADSGHLPQKQTIFEVPALAGLFTDVCLQALADRGELGLEDNIRNYLPAEVSLALQVKNTTLLHLATHTSGFPFLPEELRENIKDRAQPYANIEQKDIWNYLSRCSEKSRPGNFRNSDFGIALLARLLEEKTGCPFSQLIQKELCGPLNLKHTTVQLPEQDKELLIQGHGPTGENANYWNCGALYGAGAVYTSMEDILAFLEANLRLGNSVLSQTLRRTHRKYAAGYSTLGWKTSQEYEKLFKLKNLLWIGGRTAGFSAYMAIDVQQDIAAAVFTAASVPLERYGAYLMHILSHTSFHRKGTDR